MMMISHWASYVIFVGQSSVTQINGDHRKKNAFLRAISHWRKLFAWTIRANNLRECVFTLMRAIR